MTLTTQTPTQWHDLLEETRGRRSPDEPHFLRMLRERAFARFETLGIPTTKHEEWRFTNISPAVARVVRLPASADARVDRAAIENFAVPGLLGPTFVFVNGKFSPSLSQLEPLGSGVRAENLAAAIARGDARLETHLGRIAELETNAFTALNTSFFDDGMVLFVDRGATPQKPIRVLHVSTTTRDPLFLAPRCLIVVDDEARAQVIEDFVSVGESSNFTASVTEVVVGNGANVEHTRIEREGMDACAVSALHIEQGRHSNFASHSALLGGGIVRNGVYPVLRGEHCTSLLNGLYVAVGTQLHDNHMRVRHAEPHCDSRQFYRGILNDKARGVFSGRIIVHEGAQKTDAKQTAMSLLLSEDAHVEARPQLEIYADDVKCTHGATVGQIDPDALFYLRARGIDEGTARNLLLFAFANEVLDRMEIEPVREFLKGLVAERLPALSEAKALR